MCGSIIDAFYISVRSVRFVLPLAKNGAIKHVHQRQKAGIELKRTLHALSIGALKEIARATSCLQMTRKENNRRFERLALPEKGHDVRHCREPFLSERKRVLNIITLLKEAFRVYAGEASFLTSTHF